MFKMIRIHCLNFLSLFTGILLMLTGGQSSILAQVNSLGNSGYGLDTIRFNDLKLIRPAHLAMDTIDQYVFVSDPGKGAVIMIDRKNVQWKEIFRQVGAKPDYIALDMDMKIVYWTDRSDGSIWRSNYNGSSAMPIYRKRNELMEFLLFDSSVNRLMYLDNKAMAIKSVTTLGTDPGVVFKSGKFDIKAMSLSSSNGLLYIGIESLPGAKIGYKTISILDVKSRKSEPILPDCTNDFSRILVSRGKLLWTKSNPGRLVVYSLINSSGTTEIGLNHNPADFVWVEHTNELFYLTLKDKMIFVSSPKNMKVSADSEVNAAANQVALMDSVESPEIDSLNPLTGQTFPIQEQRDTFKVSGVDSLFSIAQKKDTIEAKSAPGESKGKQYFRIHEVRIKLKTGNVISMFLHDADDQYLYALSSNYLQYNYPKLTGQGDLFMIPINEVLELRILKSYYLEVDYNKPGKPGKKGNRSIPFVIGGLLGFGADVLAIASGALIFPLGTILGGGIGMLVAIGNYDSYSTKFRAIVLHSKSMYYTIDLKKGNNSQNTQLIKSFAMVEFNPDNEQMSRSGLIRKTNRD